MQVKFLKRQGYFIDNFVDMHAQKWNISALGLKSDILAASISYNRVVIFTIGTFYAVLFKLSLR